MDRLSSCYFCGIALDEPLQDYPLAAGDGEAGTMITLCPGCHRKLETVLEVLAGSEEGVDLPALEATERPELEGEPEGILTEPDEEPIAMGSGRPEPTAEGPATEESPGVADAGGDDKGMTDLFEGDPGSGAADADAAPEEPAAASTDGTGAEDPADAGSGGEGTDAGDAAEPDESAGQRDPDPLNLGDGTAGNGAAGGRGDTGQTGEAAEAGPAGERATEAGEADPEPSGEPEDGSGPESAPGPGPGAESESEPEPEPEPASDEEADPAPGSEPAAARTGRGDSGDGGSGPRVSALEYNKVMRLLQNREFPVDREEIVAVAANAYELSEAECRSVIDLAVDRGLLDEEDGSLARPDG